MDFNLNAALIVLFNFSKKYIKVYLYLSLIHAPPWHTCKTFVTANLKFALVKKFSFSQSSALLGALN